MHPGENMLVYSSDSPEQVRKIQEEGKEKISFMLEQLTAELAARAAGSGYRRLIVAGGYPAPGIPRVLDWPQHRARCTGDGSTGGYQNASGTEIRKFWPGRFL